MFIVKCIHATGFLGPLFCILLHCSFVVSAYSCDAASIIYSYINLLFFFLRALSIHLCIVFLWCHSAHAMSCFVFVHDTVLCIMITCIQVRLSTSRRESFFATAHAFMRIKKNSCCFSRWFNIFLCSFWLRFRSTTQTKPVFILCMRHFMNKEALESIKH